MKIRIYYIFILAITYQINLNAQANNNPFDKYPTCKYGQDTCSEDSYCVYTSNKDVARCLPRFSGEIPTIKFPFVSPVLCWKSIDSSPTSSHAWLNTKFAVDLYTDKIDERSKVYAGVNGFIVAHDDCQQGQPLCLGGFGNQVKIFTDNGIMVYYAHLKRLFVKTGDFVEAGDLIGIEGATGNVGSMWEANSGDFHHLHISVHSKWGDVTPDHNKAPHPAMPSIPFQFILKMDPPNGNGTNQIMDVRNLPCTKFDETVPYLWTLK